MLHKKKFSKTTAALIISFSLLALMASVYSCGGDQSKETKTDSATAVTPALDTSIKKTDSTMKKDSTIVDSVHKTEQAPPPPKHN